MRDPGGYFRGAYAATKVFYRGDAFQMNWIATRSVSAQMIDAQTCRNWPDMDLIRDAMNVLVFARQLDLPVAVPVSGSLPKPAAVRVHFDMAKQVCLDCFRRPI